MERCDITFQRDYQEILLKELLITRNERYLRSLILSEFWGLLIMNTLANSETVICEFV
jgi:hypothetical protein